MCRLRGQRLAPAHGGAVEIEPLFIGEARAGPIAIGADGTNSGLSRSVRVSFLNGVTS
jgi:hypothetical protein